MHSEHLRGAKRQAQNFGVTEAPLEQFSKEGGKMISGGIKTPKNVILQAKKRENLELGGSSGPPAPPPLAYGPASVCQNDKRYHSMVVIQY